MIDFDEFDAEEYEKKGNYDYSKFMLYDESLVVEDTPKDALCYIINKSYNGITQEQDMYIWDVDIRTYNLRCLDGYYTDYKYTIPSMSDINERLSTKKMDFLLNLDHPIGGAKHIDESVNVDFDDIDIEEEEKTRYWIVKSHNKYFLTIKNIGYRVIKMKYIRVSRNTSKITTIPSIHVSNFKPLKKSDVEKIKNDRLCVGFVNNDGNIACMGLSNLLRYINVKKEKINFLTK